MDIGAGIVLGVGLAALIVVLTVTTLRGRSARSRTAQQAAQRGWTYASGAQPVVYTLSGQVDGVPFAVESRRPAGMLGANRGSVPTVTALTMGAPPTESAGLLTPAIPEGGGLTIARALLTGPFRTIVVGSPAADLTGLADRTQQVRSAELARVRVEATSVGFAEQLLDDAVRTALDDLRARVSDDHPVVVVRTPTSSIVRVMGVVDQLDAVEAMARLAAAVRAVG